MQEKWKTPVGRSGWVKGAVAGHWRRARPLSCSPAFATAGGTTDCRLIPGMAEAYYASIAPHNPLGPISLAAGAQLAASIPKLPLSGAGLAGEGYIKQPF
jgi:hypothetical protein